MSWPSSSVESTGKRVHEVAARDLFGRHLQTPHAPAKAPGHEPSARERQQQGGERGEQHALADERDGGLHLLEVARVQRDSVHRPPAAGPGRLAEERLGDEPYVLPLEGAEAGLVTPAANRAAQQGVVSGEEGLLARVEARVELKPAKVALGPDGRFIPIEERDVGLRVLGHASHRAGDLPLALLPERERFELRLVDPGHQLEVAQPALFEVRLRVGDHREVDDRQRRPDDGEEDEGELVAKRTEPEEGRASAAHASRKR